jgi:CheY-like chemotaxis protein
VTLDDVDRAEVFAVFAMDAPSRADNIEHALESLRTSPGKPVQEAMESLEFEAHAVRGAAATVRLPDIVNAAERLERSAATWDASSTGALDAVVAQAERLVELLRDVQPVPPPRIAAADDRVPSGSVVVHIEDNESNLKLVERILERRPGVELVEARTAGEGLALAATLRPSLVVLDMRLPDLSGEEVLRRLRAGEATRDTAVVVVSAEARPTEADRVLAAGADEYLVKPIDVGAFLAVVDRMLARARR